MDVFQRYVPFATLDLADIAPIKSAIQRELLLGKARTKSEFTNPIPKGFPYSCLPFVRLLQDKRLS